MLATVALLQGSFGAASALAILLWRGRIGAGSLEHLFVAFDGLPRGAASYSHHVPQDAYNAIGAPPSGGRSTGSRGSPDRLGRLLGFLHLCRLKAALLSRDGSARLQPLPRLVFREAGVASRDSTGSSHGHSPARTGARC